MPVLADLLFTIVSGFVERINDKLRVVVITRSPSIEGQRISESMGIDRMELWSDAVQISDNPNEATIFSYTATYTTRIGMLGMPRYPNPIPCSVTQPCEPALKNQSLRETLTPA